MKEKIIEILDRFPTFNYWIDEGEESTAVTRQTKDGVLTINITNEDDVYDVLTKEFVLPYL